VDLDDLAIPGGSISITPWMHHFVAGLSFRSEQVITVSTSDRTMVDFACSLPQCEGMRSVSIRHAHLSLPFLACGQTNTNSVSREAVISAEKLLGIEIRKQDRHDAARPERTIGQFRGAQEISALEQRAAGSFVQSGPAG